ncbi:hypothetical protein ALC60_11733 [Trachymyrmex zeteki]|uniref:Uncharacterized protein n=1 Tax=Mycetomoellerius zeteki TaxID=64791 RepID=A0A151WNE4_9HYME|nr:hypothetical protein ALC60_11733 [Trachymyrmex zeteki]
MDTRNKKPLNDPGIENYNLKSKEPVTKEHELRMIEQAILERERKLKSRKAEYEQRAEKLENDMCMLERERETLAKIEDEKEWQDSRNFASNTSRETQPQPPDGSPYYFQFTRACRRAKEIITLSAERNFTKLLINKLGRRAYYAVEDEPCNSVTELIDLLTDAFGTAKTLDQYRGELSIIFLKSGEHVLDYISRVKNLRTAILDAERRERGELDPRFVAEIDNLTATSFYEGLPLEYRLQISPEAHLRHTDAFAVAKTIAKRAELDKQRLRNDRDAKQTVPARKPLVHSTPLRQNYLGRTSYSRDLPGTTDRNRDNRNREPPRNPYNRGNDYRRRDTNHVARYRIDIQKGKTKTEISRETKIDTIIVPRYRHATTVRITDIQLTNVESDSTIIHNAKRRETYQVRRDTATHPRRTNNRI